MRRLLLFALAVSAPAGAADHTIRIVGFSYEPKDLVMTDEDRVTIEAEGFHPLFADDFSFQCSSTCSPALGPGRHGFHCGNHGAPGSGMSGSVTVVRATLFADGFEAP
jgi:hypothetical protein